MIATTVGLICRNNVCIRLGRRAGDTMRYLLFMLALIGTISAATVTYAHPNGHDRGEGDPDCAMLHGGC